MTNSVSMIQYLRDCYDALRFSDIKTGWPLLLEKRICELTTGNCACRGCEKRTRTAYCRIRSLAERKPKDSFDFRSDSPLRFACVIAGGACLRVLFMFYLITAVPINSKLNADIDRRETQVRESARQMGIYRCFKLGLLRILKI